MVISVFYVGYRIGLQFTYLSAVLIAINTASFCQRMLICFKKDGSFCHVKRSYSNKKNPISCKTNKQRSTRYYMYLKIEA